MANAAEKPREMIPADEVERIMAERIAAAVEAANAASEARITAQLDAFKQSLASSGPSSGGDTTWMKGLAEAFADVTDRQQGRPRVSPEEQSRRNTAHERMVALIDKTVERGVQPTYTTTNVVYLGEQIIRPIYIDRSTKLPAPMEIGWWAIPNEFMQPTNEQAREIHALFLESIGGAKKHARLRVTAGGLTVRSGGMNPEGGRDSAPRVGRDTHVATIKGRGNESHAIETRILGTLHPAARQMI